MNNILHNDKETNLTNRDNCTTKNSKLQEVVDSETKEPKVIVINIKPGKLSIKSN